MNPPKGWSGVSGQYFSKRRWKANVFLAMSGACFWILGFAMVWVFVWWSFLLSLPFFYFGTAFFMNKTEVEISPVRISVRRGPLWLPKMKNLDLPVEQISHWEIVRSDEGLLWTFQIVKTDHSKVVFLDCIGDDERALMRGFFTEVLPVKREIA